MIRFAAIPIVLATLAGWWRGLDVKLREEVGTQDAAATQRDLVRKAG